MVASWVCFRGFLRLKPEKSLTTSLADDITDRVTQKEPQDLPRDAKIEVLWLTFVV